MHCFVLIQRTVPMGKKNKSEQLKAVVAEFRVSMHCNACERSVAKTISKFKGVEKFSTDMNSHKVVVMGKFDPQKVAKKLGKKTGKRVDMVVDNKKDDEANESMEGIRDLKAVSSNPFLIDHYMNCKEMEKLMIMFSDENPNACLVM